MYTSILCIFPVLFSNVSWKSKSFCLVLSVFPYYKQRGNEYQCTFVECAIGPGEDAKGCSCWVGGYVDFVTVNSHYHISTRRHKPGGFFPLLWIFGKNQSFELSNRRPEMTSLCYFDLHFPDCWREWALICSLDIHIFLLCQLPASVSHLFFYWVGLINLWKRACACV